MLVTSVISTRLAKLIGSHKLAMFARNTRAAHVYTALARKPCSLQVKPNLRPPSCKG